MANLHKAGNMTLPAGASHDHLAPLTGLRAVAAYSVLVAHAIDTSFFFGGVAVFHSFAVRLAYFGMSLFFVLSGFVIYYNYAESFRAGPVLPAAWKFFVARFARLYPLFCVGILISLPHIPAPIFADNPGVLLAYATMTQSWFNVQMAIFTPYWSISTEWFFYFAFIFLLPFVDRLGARPLRTLCIYCALMFVAVACVLNLFAEPLQAFGKRWLLVNEKVSTDPWGWIIYMGPPLRLLEFIAGMLAARTYLALRDHGYGRRHMQIALTIAPLWCFLVIFVAGTTEQVAPLLSIMLPNFIYAPALALFMVFVCLSSGWFKKILASRLAVFMGEISYSVYTWSFFVMTMLGASYLSPSESIEAWINSGIKVAIVAFLTTVFSYGSYLIIEMPARRWLRSVLSPLIAKAPRVARQEGQGI